VNENVCYAPLICDNTQSSNAVIAVPPVLGEVSPTFLIQKEGDTVDMFCEASATPAPVLTWRKDGRLLVPNERVRLAGNRVQLRRLERTDGGAYSCTFANPVGNVTHVIRLVVEGTKHVNVRTSSVMRGRREGREEERAPCNMKMLINSDHCTVMSLMGDGNMPPRCQM
jgi:hypothetical protein